MTTFLNNLIDECKKISSSLAINVYDIYGVVKEENSASAKEGKPFALNSSHKSYITLRVWNNSGHVGITSTSNLTPEGLTTAFSIAMSSAQFCDPDIYYDFSPLCLEKIKSESSELESDFVSIQNLAQAAIECESFILKSSPSIKSIPYNKVTQSFSQKFYFNNLNAFRQQKIPSSYCYFYPLAQEENKLPRQLGHLSIANDFKSLNYLECAKIALEKTKKHLDYKKIETGKYTVIFSPEAFLDIIGAFSNFFNAQNILDKKSLSTKETLNTKIASSFLNITDEPLHSEHVGKSYFDEEGTPTAELVIVKEGVLTHLLQTSYTAKLFQTKPTGHTSLGSKLTAHAHFLRIFADHNKMNLKKPENLSTAIYIEEVKALHAGINAFQGSFSLPFDGFIIENGKYTSIESATVAGDFLTLLKDISYISPDEKITPSGICPEIWVNNLSIAGS